MVDFNPWEPSLRYVSAVIYVNDIFFLTPTHPPTHAYIVHTYAHMYVRLCIHTHTYEHTLCTYRHTHIRTQKESKRKACM